MNSTRKILIGVAVCVGVALIANMTFIGTAVSYIHNNRMAYGLSVGKSPVGGMTREEASHTAERSAKTALSGNVLILSTPDGEKTFSFSAEEIGLSANLDATLDQAYRVGRDGASSFWDMLRCAFQGKDVPFSVALDDEKLKSVLQRVKKDVDRKPVDAYISFSPQGIVHNPATTGRILNAEELIAKIAPQLRALTLPCKETLSPTETPAAVQLEDIQPINGMLSSCSTGYYAGTGRGDNIELAASTLNNTLVRPGEELSFNTKVGPRVASAGYADAPVIVNGKVEEDVGGGVCQVSSTLYNAILTANLTPMSRTAHFYPSSYLPAGLDATVADGQIDFVFKNTLPHSVLLRAGGSEGTLTIQVYGCTADMPGEIEMETSIIGPPPTVEVYKVIYKGDTEISREYLYTDVYDVPPPPDPKPEPAQAAPPAPEPAAEPAPTPPAEPAPTPAPAPTAPTAPTAPSPMPAPSKPPV